VGLLRFSLLVFPRGAVFALFDDFFMDLFFAFGGEAALE
jgi:hypothetical protein